MGVVIHHPSQNNTKTIKKPPSTTKMAGTSPLLKRPQQPTVQQPQSVREQIIHHHHHHHFNDEYISPTYKSTPLFKPEISPYDQVELPSQGRHAWGTHIHQHGGIGPLSFLGSQPKSRDLYVARSHRHYLSGFSYVRHDRINKSHITPFKKALNRANDDLVPPAALIPLEKYGRIQEDTQVIKSVASFFHKAARKPSFLWRPRMRLKSCWISVMGRLRIMSFFMIRGKIPG